MKKKFIWLLVLIIAFSLVAVGCGQSKVQVEVQSPEEAAKMEGDPLQNLAIKEKQWLGSLDSAHAEIAQSFTDWEQGKITKEDFMNQLKKTNGRIKSLIKAYDLHMEVNYFPEDEKNEAVYKDGLSYGDKLRTIVNNFIFMSTDGILDSETKELKPLTDDQIKDLYKNYMVEKYNDYRAKLEPALKEANKK
ncbi:hypothetical protein [Desulforamulus ruminis]|uniref:hypothetical protein n=1 Tax=Desulforamulus ruminis TaxID=1564 RepID=UPI002353FE7C|nr:hypothetical protein [Desulforamulus ruminis]